MTVLAALATAIRERLVAGADAPLPGLGTLTRHHVPARLQSRPDGSRVLLPPSETIRFSRDASDPSAVAAALARTRGLEADGAAPALRDAVDQLEAIVVATGEARLPGVGLFRRTSSSVLFAADTALLAEVNRPYAGLQPVEAAPAAPTPETPPPADAPPADTRAAGEAAPGAPSPEATPSPDTLQQALEAEAASRRRAPVSDAPELEADDTPSPPAASAAAPAAAPSAAEPQPEPEGRPEIVAQPGAAEPRRQETADAAPSDLDVPAATLDTTAPDLAPQTSEPDADGEHTVGNANDSDASEDAPEPAEDAPETPAPLDDFLDSRLRIGERRSRRRGQSGLREPAGRAAAGPAASAPETEAVAPEAEGEETLAAPDPAEPLATSSEDDAPRLDPDADSASDDSTVRGAHAPLPPTADVAMPMPDDAFSLGDDLFDEDLAGADPLDSDLAPGLSRADLGMPDWPAPHTDEGFAPTRSPTLNDIYATGSPPSPPDTLIGADLDAASAASTALGLGLDGAGAPPPASPDRAAHAPDPADRPAAPSVRERSRPGAPRAEDRWFSFGSLLLLAVSLAAIAAAATWPRIAGPPPPPAPTAGGGAFGDTLGDAAEAAFRERLTLAQDSTPPARVEPDADEPTAPPAASYQAVEIAPGAVPPPAATAPARRTQGVPPPADTAILPPRVAGLDGQQTRALASRYRFTPGAGYTWVVLSSPGRDEATALSERYRAAGYRSAVVATTDAGRTTYRVGVGQFGSRDDARALRARLPPQAPTDTWMLDLSSTGLTF